MIQVLQKPRAGIRFFRLADGDAFSLVQQKKIGAHLPDAIHVNAEAFMALQEVRRHLGHQGSQ